MEVLAGDYPTKNKQHFQEDFFKICMLKNLASIPFDIKRLFLVGMIKVSERIKK